MKARMNDMNPTTPSKPSVVKLALVNTNMSPEVNSDTENTSTPPATNNLTPDDAKNSLNTSDEATKDKDLPASAPATTTDTPPTVTPSVTPFDPVQAASDRLFGKDNGNQLRDAAREHGVNFDGYVLSVSAQMGEMEQAQQKLVDAFEKSIGPAVWPPIVSAIGVAHQTENTRRGLVMLLENGMLSGETAQIVSTLFASYSDVSTNFMRATLTMVGGTILGYDSDTIDKRIVAPFNDIMANKQAIFDLLSQSNANFSAELREAMSKAAQMALRTSTEASNEALAVPPVGPDAAG